MIIFAILMLNIFQAYASDTSSATPSGNVWKPLIELDGGEEEIKKAQKITVTAPAGNVCCDVLNEFVKAHYDTIQAEIREAISERRALLAETTYKDCENDKNVKAIKCCKELYQNLRLSLRKQRHSIKKAADFQNQNICFLPALEAELLVGMCVMLKIRHSKPTSEEEKKALEKIVNKMYALQTILAQKTQNMLKDKENRGHKPIQNKGIDYNKHYPIKIQDWLEKNNPQGPFVPITNASNAYLPRNLTSALNHNTERVNPSRQLWTSTLQVEGPNQSKENDSKKLRFSHDDWGYNLVLEIPHVKKDGPEFYVRPYAWTSNETIHRCCFAYTRKYWVNRNLINEFGIASVDLPSWNEREYGIELLPADQCDANDPQTWIREGIRQKEHRKVLQESQIIKVDKEVTALAYDDASQYILYAHDKELKMVRKIADRYSFSNVCTFEADIKKIFVTAEGVWFVFVPGNGVDRNSKLYRVVERYNNAVTEVLNLKDVIDIAFDETTKNFVILWKDGVTQCPTGDKNMHPASPSMGQKISHPSFDYNRYKYNAIDYQNGQVSVMHKPYVETGRKSKNGCVLIYPPLTDADEVAYKQWLQKAQALLQARLEHSSYANDANSSSVAATSSVATAPLSSASAASGQHNDDPLAELLQNMLNEDSVSDEDGDDEDVDSDEDDGSQLFPMGVPIPPVGQGGLTRQEWIAQQAAEHLPGVKPWLVKPEHKLTPVEQAERQQDIENENNWIDSTVGSDTEFED